MTTVEIVSRALDYTKAVKFGAASSRGHYPAQLAHWALRLTITSGAHAHGGQFAHFLGLDLANGQIVLSQEPFNVDEHSSFVAAHTDSVDLDAFVRTAAAVFASRNPQYQIVANNCQHLAVQMYFAIASSFGANSFFHLTVSKFHDRGLVRWPAKAQYPIPAQALISGNLGHLVSPNSYSLTVTGSATQYNFTVDRHGRVYRAR